MSRQLDLQEQLQQQLWAMPMVSFNSVVEAHGDVGPQAMQSSRREMQWFVLT